MKQNRGAYPICNTSPYYTKRKDELLESSYNNDTFLHYQLNGIIQQICNIYRPEMTKTGYTGDVNPVNRWAMWAINSLIIMINRLFKSIHIFV